MTENHSCEEIRVQPLQLVGGRDFWLLQAIQDFRAQVERMKPAPKYPPCPEDDPE